MRHHHVELYECEVCGTRYPTPAEAGDCEAGKRPLPRYRCGDTVMLVDGGYRSQFPGQLFRVDSSAVFLDRPGLDTWRRGQRGHHLVTYVIEADCDHCRITFVPEHHLAPAEATATDGNPVPSGRPVQAGGQRDGPAFPSQDADVGLIGGDAYA